MHSIIPILFINCFLYPFIDMIGSGCKVYETRTRNTLKSLIGKRVLLCETGLNRRKYINYTARIESVLIVDNPEQWEAMRQYTCIEPGSKYDWNQETKVKYLYKLANVKRIPDFTPAEGKRHGRVWMEYNGKESD